VTQTFVAREMLVETDGVRIRRDASISKRQKQESKFYVARREKLKP